MKSILLPGEEVIERIRANAWALLPEVIVLLLIAAGTGAGIALLPATWKPWGYWAVAGLAVLLLLLLVLRPLFGWLSTTCTITNQRVILGTGLINRVQHDVLLPHIQEVAHRQGFWQRFSRSGTLLLSTTSGDVLRIPRLPQIERLHALVAELAWAQGNAL
jgi:uncharacterized membrane protein YdbT with pleckstrin-like domain